MNWMSPKATASATSVVKRRRPASTLDWMSSRRPGSWMGTPPLFRVAILAGSMSRQQTELPMSARQVPVTRPT